MGVHVLTVFCQPLSESYLVVRKSLAEYRMPPTGCNTFGPHVGLHHNLKRDHELLHSVLFA